MSPMTTRAGISERPGADEEGPVARAVPWVAAIAAGVLLITAYYLLPLHYFSRDRPVLCWTTFGIVLALLAFVTVIQVTAVSAGVRRAVSFGLPVVLFLIIVVFASFYTVLARVPGQFQGLSTRTDSLYFTVTTLSTVGYGDIYPAGQAARIVATVQIMFGMVLVAGAANSLREATARRRRDRMWDRAGTDRR
jgi:voltage-gated potassium channel